jgi:hypothetical protein
MNFNKIQDVARCHCSVKNLQDMLLWQSVISLMIRETQTCLLDDVAGNITISGRYILIGESDEEY